MTLINELRTGTLLAVRGRYLLTCLWLLIAVLTLAIMAAEFSGRQPTTVTLDVGLSAVRLLLPLLIILLSQDLVTREFDRRYILTSLTYPRPRYHFLLGRMITTLLLTYGAMLVIAIALAGLCNYIASTYQQVTPPNLGSYYWLTFLFIAIDLFVLTAFSTLLAVTASSPSFVLVGSLGFMLISRSYSHIIALLTVNQGLFENTEQYQQSLSLLNYLFPDLGALDIRSISLYNTLKLLPADWLANIGASLSYGVLLIGFSLFLLQRKRFN